MKHILLLVLFTSVLSVNAQCLRQDTFTAIDEPDQYPIEGTVVMQFETDGSKQVVFQEDFATVQGLELRVFLSTTERLAQGGTEIEISTEPLQDDNGGQDMGDLITGMKIFDIPDTIGLEDFDYVIVQCVQADVLWGRAFLGELEGEDCATLSLEETNLLQTQLYPNPATTSLHITSPTENIEVAMYDTLGRKIYSQTGTQVMDISNFKSGVYFVQLTEGEKQRTIKVIRQ